MKPALALPIYSPNLQKEDASMALLRNAIPKNWIIRPVENRDMGIDGEIEIWNPETNQLTGKHFKFQIKSTVQLTWRQAWVADSNPIKVSTANYWLGFEPPVFLFQADLTEQIIYFEAVGPQLRRMFGKMQDRSPIRLQLHRWHWLGGPEQLEVLQKQYDTERGLTEVMGAAEHLLSELENYAAFLEEVQGRDPWMEAEPGKVERLREIYERVTALGLHLGRDAALPFNQAVQKYEDQLALGGDMHEYTVTELCREVELDMAHLAHHLLTLIYIDEGTYWKRRRPTLHEQCKKRLRLTRRLPDRTALRPVHKRRETSARSKRIDSTRSKAPTAAIWGSERPSAHFAGRDRGESARSLQCLDHQIVGWRVRAARLKN